MEVGELYKLTCKTRVEYWDYVPEKGHDQDIPYIDRVESLPVGTLVMYECHIETGTNWDPAMRILYKDKHVYMAGMEIHTLERT